MQSMITRGFSPLIWLTRPSATRTQGLNIHPHDGNIARIDNEAPASWSAAVTAMTCDFNMKSYSTLGQESDICDGVGASCIILAAPKEVKYLSSTDVKARHEKIIGHEWEVITPHIDSSDTVAILFIERGKITRVAVNANINSESYTMDMQLPENLKKLLVDATPEARINLEGLIDNLKQHAGSINLMQEFDSRFNDNVDELLEKTRASMNECDSMIEKMPGIIGKILRSSQPKRELLSREETAAKLEVPLPESNVATAQ